MIRLINTRAHCMQMKNKSNTTLTERKPIRLKNRDYTRGVYYLTICTKDKKCLFGKITDGQMKLNSYGEIVKNSWNDLPNHYNHVNLDEYIVMPDHFHGIIMLDNARVGAGFKPAHMDNTAHVQMNQTPQPTPMDDATARTITAIKKRHALPEIIRAFKTFSAKQINILRKTPGLPVWQRNYYERIVRNVEMNRIREYIRNNASQLSNPMEPYSESQRAGLKPAPTQTGVN